MTPAVIAHIAAAIRTNPNRTHTGKIPPDGLLWVYHPDGESTDVRGPVLMVYQLGRTNPVGHYGGATLAALLEPPAAAPGPESASLNSHVWVRLTPDGADVLLLNIGRHWKPNAADHPAEFAAREWPGFNAGAWVRFLLSDLFVFFAPYGLPGPPEPACFFQGGIIRLKPPEPA